MMKKYRLLTVTLSGLMVASVAATVLAKSPKMKMTTPIPPKFAMKDGLIHKNALK